MAIVSQSRILTKDISHKSKWVLHGIFVANQTFQNSN